MSGELIGKRKKDQAGRSRKWSLNNISKENQLILEFNAVSPEEVLELDILSG